MRLHVVPSNMLKPSSKNILTVPRRCFLCDQYCYLCFVSVLLSFLFIVALCSPAEKGLTSWLSCFDVFLCFCYFPCGGLCQARYLIVSIPDRCLLPYFANMLSVSNFYDKKVSEYDQEIPQPQTADQPMAP